MMTAGENAIEFNRLENFRSYMTAQLICPQFFPDLLIQELAF
jgi:hypothetical protein